MKKGKTKAKLEEKEAGQDSRNGSKVRYRRAASHEESESEILISADDEMEESDVEEDLRRLTNLKPIKKKKHRFGLPVWCIPWPVFAGFTARTSQSVGFNVAVASHFHTNWLKSKVCQHNAISWKTCSSVALQTHWPIMQECLFILCESSIVKDGSLLWLHLTCQRRFRKDPVTFPLWLPDDAV